MTAKQYELCIKSLMLLQMCPIPCQLAKETIFDICLTKDAHELAAVLLPSFLPKTGNLCQVRECANISSKVKSIIFLF